MSIIFKPEVFLGLVLGKNFFKGKLLTSGLDFKKAQMQAILKATGLKKRVVTSAIYKVIDFYEKKVETLKKENVKAYKKEALNDEKLLKNRLEGLIVYNEVENLKQEHKGKYYRWLPSAAKVPEPEHQLLYGKIFKVGEGDKDGNMPCERYGCKCGIEILTDEDVKKYLGKD